MIDPPKNAVLIALPTYKNPIIKACNIKKTDGRLDKAIRRYATIGCKEKSKGIALAFSTTSNFNALIRLNNV